MSRDVYGSYHMMVDPATALGLATIGRVDKRKAETAATKAAATATLERAEKQKTVDAAAKATAEAALEAEKTRQWLASDGMNFGLSSPMPPPPMGSRGVTLPATCAHGRRRHCLKCGL